MVGIMLNMFSAMWNKFYSALRGLPGYVKGIIIFAIVMSALVCFIFAVKGSKKDKFVKNWFLFFLCILLTIVGVVFCIIM
ncbi:MAG TPA: hypothetical protein DD621_02235 [Clostridiales bacterium]|nr:hypothetical protein [Clostridiales bacterium]